MAIVTPEWKYINWYYGGDGMKPAEELFDLSKDGIEMHNLAADPGRAAQLDAMRKQYDAQLSSLATSAAGSYAPYAILFDRTVPWERKEHLMKVP